MDESEETVTTDATPEDASPETTNGVLSCSVIASSAAARPPEPPSALPVPTAAQVAAAAAAEAAVAMAGQADAVATTAGTADEGGSSHCGYTRPDKFQRHGGQHRPLHGQCRGQTAGIGYSSPPLFELCK